MYDPNRVALPPDMMGITSVPSGVPMPDLQRGQMMQAPAPGAAPSLGSGGFANRPAGGFGPVDGRALADAFKTWAGARPGDPRGAEFEAWRGQMPNLLSFMAGQVPPAPQPAPQVAPTPVAPSYPAQPQTRTSYPNPVHSRATPQGYGQHIPQQAQSYLPGSQSYLPGAAKPRPPVGASGGFFGTRKGR